MSWIPFYWLGKCAGLALLFLPGGNIPSVVFERVVVWGMDNAHDTLNNLVVPNVVQFAVSLPWRMLLVLFPAIPPPASGRAGLHPKKGVTGKGNGLAHRLQHLQVPTSPTSPGANFSGDGRRRNSPHRAGAAVATAEVAPLQVKRVSSLSPPPLPPRTPVTTPRGKEVNLTGQASAAVSIGADEAGGLREDHATNNTPDVARHLTERDASQDGLARTPSARDEGRGGANSTEGSPEDRRGSVSRRKSFGEMVRSALTGNSEIRLRDHLFDLNTASPAPPQSASREPQPDPPAATTAAAASSKPRHERGRAKQQASDATAAAAAALPPISDSSDSGKRRARREVGAVDESPAVSSTATRARHATRQRLSEFSELSFTSDRSGGGDGGGGGSSGSGDGSGGGARGGSIAGVGGGEIGGGPAEDSGRGLRRRNPPGRRSQEKNKNPYTSAGSTAPTLTGGRSANTSVPADSRAQRLVEWRKRRAEQASAQQKDKSRTSRMAANTDSAAPGSNPSPGSAAAAAGANGTTPGGPTGRRPNAAPSRRFRHVERFRSEMASNAGGSPPKEADDAASHAPSPKSASVGRSQ